MKILQPLKSLSGEIYNTSVQIARAGKNGCKIGKRTSQIYNSSNLASAVNISRGMGKQLARTTTVDNLPVIAGALGMLVPYPLTSVIFYCLGKLAQIGIKSFKKVHNKINFNSYFKENKN